jgi:hypothetical protein
VFIALLAVAHRGKPVGLRVTDALLDSVIVNPARPVVRVSGTPMALRRCKMSSAGADLRFLEMAARRGDVVAADRPARGQVGTHPGELVGSLCRVDPAAAIEIAISELLPGRVRVIVARTRRLVAAHLVLRSQRPTELRFMVDGLLVRA